MKKVLQSMLIILISFILIITFTPTKKVYAGYFEAPQHNKIYKIRNVQTGKFLNVNYGTDANGTNVIQWTEDGSIEQKWKVVFVGENDFKLYSMCSSNGNNRVLDVLRTGGSSNGTIESGNNVDIWADNDSEAQTWKYNFEENGYCTLYLSSNSDLMLTVYGTGNGSSAGKSTTSQGNVFVGYSNLADNPNNGTYCLWEFIEV